MKQNSRQLFFEKIDPDLYETFFQNSAQFIFSALRISVICIFNLLGTFFKKIMPTKVTTAAK